MLPELETKRRNSQLAVPTRTFPSTDANGPESYIFGKSLMRKNKNKNKATNIKSDANDCENISQHTVDSKIADNDGK